MDIRRIKQAYKIYDNAFGYMQRIESLLTILDSDKDEYPSNFLLAIAKRDLKQADKKMSKCWDILAKIIRKNKRLRKV